MASGSSRDLFKALNSVVASGSSNSSYHVRSLPEDVQKTIHAYLDKHERPDHGDSQKLHDELKNIYTKHVLDDRNKLGVFLHALRLLHTGITGLPRKLEWWDLVISPTLDAVGYRRDELEYATDFLLGLMAYDADGDNAAERARESTALLRKLLACYVKRSKVVDAQSEVLRREDEYITQQLEAVLVSCGRRKPKDLIVLLDELIVTKDTRIQALGLLVAFARHQPPHLYKVRETALIEHLMKCLLIDTSSTVIQHALTILVMLLPHIPSSVRKHLPTLFLIYTRLLCWDTMVHPASKPVVDHASDGGLDDDWPDENGIASHARVTSLTRQTTPDAGWDKLESLMPNPGLSQPDLAFFFTFLYGLYPLNFLSYVRKPRRYLKSIDFPRADEVEFDQLLIRKRTERYRRMHQLHPNFFTTTLEDELEDDRWLTSDPAEVVAECMGLCIDLPSYTVTPVPTVAKSQGAPSSGQADLPPELVRTEDIPMQPLNNDHADEALLTSERAGSPDQKSNSHATPSSAGPILSRRPSQRSTQTPLSALSGTESPVLPTVDSPPFHATSHAPFTSRSIVSMQSSEGPHHGGVTGSKPAMAQAQAQAQAHVSVNTALLQREVMMLRNDLNFERYLKQQHLSHMGQLQRRLIKEATHEADTQALMQTNKTLKAKLTKANESYASLKKETATGRSNSKRFETELSSRVRALREAERAWRVREEDLRVELTKAQTDCQHLRRLIVESEARELLSEKRAATMELENEQTEALKKQVSELEDRLRGYESKDFQYEETKNQLDVLQTDLATANLRLQSKDSGAERIKKAYDARVLELETQLHDALHPEPGTAGAMSPAVQTMIDHAVAMSNSRLLQVKKDYAELKRRHIELEIRCMDLEQQFEDGYMAQSTPPRPRRPDEAGDGGSVHSGTAADGREARYSGGSGRESTLSQASSKAFLPRRGLAGGHHQASSQFAADRAGMRDSSGSIGVSDRASMESGTLGSGDMYQQPGSHFSDDTLAEDAKEKRKKKRSAEPKGLGRGSSRFSNFFT